MKILSKRFIKFYQISLAVMFLVMGIVKALFDTEYLFGALFVLSGIAFIAGSKLNHRLTPFSVFGIVFQVLGLGVNSIWLWLFGISFFVTELLKELNFNKA